MTTYTTLLDHYTHTNMDTVIIPEWIHVSDLWVSLCSGTNRTETKKVAKEGEERERSDSVEGPDLSALPCCELHCGDAVRLYLVMGSWCFSWDKVPKAVFFPLWLGLTPEKRRELLSEYLYFSEELDADLWEYRMLVRDDVDLFAAVPKISMLETVRKGAIRCLRYAHSQGRNMGFPLAVEATKHGHLSCLMYIHENGSGDNGVSQNNLISIFDNFDHITIIAAENGHLNCLKYAHEHGVPWGNSRYACIKAAINGHLDCLKYAHEHGCPLTSGVLMYATEKGHLECLQYALDQGGENTYICLHAASNGRLDSLRYAHEHGCPWSKSVCINAAVYGHVDCLRYAYEHGCLCDIDECLYAAIYRRTNCLKRYPPTNLLDIPEGQQKCVDYLYTQGAEIGRWFKVIERYSQFENFGTFGYA